MTVATTDLPIELASFEVGDEVRFDGHRERWNVRATALQGRYTILTGWALDNPRRRPDGSPDIAYTIIDAERGVRGPLNVIGGGLGIDTMVGDDPAIDEAVEMLDDGFEVSHRNNVPLFITEHRTSTPQGPVLDGQRLSGRGQAIVWEWLQANGCRWKVPADATIRIRGNHLEVECFTIRTNKQSLTLWPRRIPDDWEPPTKTRRYRIRVPLNSGKGK